MEVLDPILGFTSGHLTHTSFYFVIICNMLFCCSFDFDLKLKRHYALRHKDILGKHPCTNCAYVGLSLLALRRHVRRSCKKKPGRKRLLRQKKPSS